VIAEAAWAFSAGGILENKNTPAISWKMSRKAKSEEVSFWKLKCFTRFRE